MFGGEVLWFERQNGSPGKINMAGCNVRSYYVCDFINALHEMCLFIMSLSEYPYFTADGRPKTEHDDYGPRLSILVIFGKFCGWLPGADRIRFV